MLVAASTECFRDLPLHDAVGRLVDLEYSNVEIAIDEDGIQLRPSEVESNFERAVVQCRDIHRLNVVAYCVNIRASGEEYYRHFRAICKLAKATKVVTLVVPSSELGTPFNEEVERLRRLVDLASSEGARVGMKTTIGCLTEDPDTAVVLCDNVKGLGLTFDPSHYVCGPHSRRSTTKLMKYVFHVHLRDSTKDALQVRIGQGEIEYGRLIGQLRKVHYNRTLSVHLREIPDVEHMGEMRKMRLLLESLM
ncbi:MAG: sugar phosphate isomerase/epimerase family protein [Pirellulaceae bacterium]